MTGKGIDVAFGFNLNSPVPMDSRSIAETIAERDAIKAEVRYEGLIVYVKETQQIYHLKGGTENTNWEPLKGEGGGDLNLHVDVKSHGAKGDGVTDDTVAIRNALTAARNLKLPLYISSGIYALSDTIHITKYDRIYGAGPSQTQIKCTANNMVAFSITLGELELKDMMFIRKDDTIKYTAVEIGQSTLAVIENISAYAAHKIINIRAESFGVYNTHVKNVYGWVCDYGLFCEEGSTFNANTISFRSLQGSGFDDEKQWRENTAGVVLRGTANKVWGGEIASFETGIINYGPNNSLDTVYIERTNYPVRNVNPYFFNVLACSLAGNIHPENSEYVYSEFGAGTTTITKDMGSHGANIFNGMKSYHIFDELLPNNTVYDYSGQENHLQFNDGIDIVDHESSYGKVKKLTVHRGGAAYLPYGVDTTKAHTFIWSSKTISHPLSVDEEGEPLVSFYALDINGNETGGYIRLDQNKNQVSVQKMNQWYEWEFLYNMWSGNDLESEGVWAIVFDFPNNKVLQVDFRNAIVKEIDVDLSDIPNGAPIRFCVHRSADDSVMEYAYNYFAVWDRYVPYNEIQEFISIKRHVPKIEVIRELKKDIEAVQEKVDIARPTTFPAEGTDVPLGKVIYNETPKVRDNIGWVCTTAGKYVTKPWEPNMVVSYGMYVYTSYRQVLFCQVDGTTGATEPYITNYGEDGTVGWDNAGPLALFDSYGKVGADSTRLPLDTEPLKKGDTVLNDDPKEGSYIGWVAVADGIASKTKWQPNMAVQEGDYVHTTAGRVYQTYQTGVTGTKEPTHTGYQPDGTVYWDYVDVHAKLVPYGHIGEIRNTVLPNHPDYGYQYLGKLVYNPNPTTGSPVGYVCTVAGYIAQTFRTWTPRTIYTQGQFVLHQGYLYHCEYDGESGDVHKFAPNPPDDLGEEIYDYNTAWKYIGPKGTYCSYGTIGNPVI